MRIVEKTLFILVLAGYILRLLLIYDSDLFILMFLLGSIYFYLGFALFNGIKFRAIFKKSTYSDIPTNNILVAVLSGFAMSIGCIGILFKIQRWPGAIYELLFGTILCSVFFVIGMTKRKGQYSDLYKRILTRVSVLLCFSILFLCVPAKVLFEVTYRDHPVYIQTQERSWADPSNKELRKEAMDEWEKTRYK